MFVGYVRRIVALLSMSGAGAYLLSWLYIAIQDVRLLNVLEKNTPWTGRLEGILPLIVAVLFSISVLATTWSFFWRKDELMH